MGDTTKRVLKINPDLFKMTNNTRKATNKSKDSPKIKMKAEPKNNKSLRRNVMKMIREKQQEEYKRLFEKQGITTIATKPTSSEEFSKDFEESYKYLSGLVDKTEEVKTDRNQTLRNYPNPNSNSILLHQSTPILPLSENVSMILPEIFNETPLTIRNSHPEPPRYGCLKNGLLPTYRTWKNNTQRANPYISTQQTQPQMQPIQMQPPKMQMQPTTNLLQNTSYSAPSFIDKPQNTLIEDNKENVSQKAKDEWKNALETQEKVKSFKKRLIQEHQQKKLKQMNKGQNKMRYLKQKKIYRRTYAIGKSKVFPRVGVLISNHTIRKRIHENMHQLTQTPIQDVRKYLVKKGFIKIGTSTPNDVLRKMYETVSSVCGEIQNHNSENLLYNFIHDT